MPPSRRPTLLAALAVAAALVVLWAALAAARRLRAPSRREGFDEKPVADSDAEPELKTVHELRTKEGARAEVVDTGRADLGKCLMINGKVQLCERDEHRYHEMLVHFPAAYLPEGPERVLIVGGADCMALREVLKYPSLKAVVVIEPDEQLVSLCEDQFLTSRQTKDARVRFLFGPVGDTVRRLHTPENLQTYDLVIVDTKERPGVSASASGKEFVGDLHVLLSPRGVLVKNGDGAESALRQSFAHVLPFGFDAPTFSKRYVMAIASDSDLRSRKIDASAIKDKHSISTTFYKPDQHLSFIPWLSQIKRTGLNAVAASVRK